MSEFTPGPWKRSDSSACIVDSESGEICQVDLYHEFERDVREANARLIAAAPELLEACKQLVAFIEEIPEDDVPVTNDEDEMMIKVHNAITKARGES